MTADEWTIRDTARGLKRLYLALDDLITLLKETP